MQKMNLTREQLYTLVWEKPLRFIIESYGGTYQDVKELLEKYNIPAPENGYWSKLRAGHTLKIPSLHLLTGKKENLVIYEPKERMSRLKNKEVHNKITAEKQQTHQLKQAMPEDKFVVEARRLFQKELKGDVGSNRLISIGSHALPINVSAKMIDRALEIINLFILGIKQIGGEIEMKPNRTSVLYREERLELSLREKQNRVEQLNSKYSWEAYDYLPSGILVFKLGENSWDVKEWKDTAYTILEDKIDDILAYIPKKIIKIQEERREIERRRLEHEKEHQRQLELEKRKTTEINNFIALKTNAELWKNASLMREYLQAMEDAAKLKGTYDVKIQEYLTWARKKVDCYDPLVDATDKLFEHMDKLSLTSTKKLGW